LAPQNKPIERIDADERYAAAASILRTLENGVSEIQGEIDALRIEDELAHRPQDHRLPAAGAVFRSSMGRHGEALGTQRRGAG
jgi:hypothetical protein